MALRLSLGIVFASLALASGMSADDILRFEQFEKDFGKVYTNRMSRASRMRTFVDNLRIIDAHNVNPLRTYNMGVNKFTDLTDEEFSEGYMGYKRAPGFAKKTVATSRSDPKSLPKHVDWREKGAIGVVRDQGHCGSCWAQASAETIESYVFLATGTLPTVSIQQITSCSVNPYMCGGVGGCKGAISQVGFMYAQLFGLTLEEEYPYVSGETTETETCTFNPNSKGPKAHIRGYETLPSNDMEAVLRHLAEVGPLSVNVDAGPFQHYENGIIEGCDFSKNININHVVQLIGYGTDEKVGPYWLIKNSWGSDWGDNGVLKLKRYPETQCGYDATPLNGTGCVHDGNDVQRVCGNCGIIFDTSYPIGASFGKSAP
eukprot:TRINITY_DN4704_c0_g1_i1.p1 TRINITY_DN4704_c0_g1~~TRINITY_DN4704_c0_g1_i1.p1  ORF type:complete len:373 (+),score=89.60 TRINITY_DN4704_c0_g1_i1:2-1120(+)